VTASGECGDMAGMHWLYYVLAGAAVLVLLNVVLVLYVAWATRESE
jgi:hypothetical protein